MSQALAARVLRSWVPSCTSTSYKLDGTRSSGRTPASSFLGSHTLEWAENAGHQHSWGQRKGDLTVRASNRNPPKKPPPAGNVVRGLAQREKYLKPFMLDIFFSNRNSSAKVMNRINSHVVAGVSTNEKKLRMSLVCGNDIVAARKIGELLAERAAKAEVYSVTFELRREEKWDEKYDAVMTALVENGIKIV